MLFQNITAEYNMFSYSWHVCRRGKDFYFLSEFFKNYKCHILHQNEKILVLPKEVL